MKLPLLIFCTVLLSATVYSQNPDKTLVKVLYSFTHIRDTTQRDKPYTETMMLLAGKNASYYTSFDRLNRNVNLICRQEMEKQGLPREQIGGQITSQIRNAKPVSGIELYFFNKEHIYFSAEEIVFTHLVEEPIAVMDWKISKDTLNFSGIHCQKATATFKGRNWIAWFATELPFQSGPWKLNGLPGLIIEAYDDKKEVQFRFEGLEKIKPGDMITKEAYEVRENLRNSPGFSISEIAIHFDNSHIRTPRKEFDKLKAAHDKDPMAFGGNGGGGGGGAGGVVGASGAAAPLRAPVATQVIPVNVINNPIELTK